MSLKKLALVTAMFAATSGAFAMEAMDEESLAATTGQDGITISLATSANLNVIIHDKDGLTGTSQAGFANSGAILLSGISIDNGVANTDANIGITIDSGASAALANDATLNIGITTGALRVGLGTLTVANSARETGVEWGIDPGTQSAALLNMGSISTSGVAMNIQLGNEPQGDMIALNTTLTNGLTLTGSSLNDVNSLGSISVGTLSVSDAGAGANLTVDLGINATATGLTVRVDALGTGGMDVTMANVVLGGGAGIGDVEINGLNLTGDTITIRGH